MATEIFPGVYTQIVDNSYYVRPLPGTIAFIPFVSEKGPDNELWLSTGPRDLLKTFGNPHKATYGEGLYVAYNFNLISSNLYVMRVLPTDASYANIVMEYDHATTTLSLTSRNNLYSKANINTEIANSTTALVLYPVGRGQYYNNISINLTPSLNVSNAYDLDIYAVDPNGQTYIAESYLVGLHESDTDIHGQSIFIEVILERYSEILRAVVNKQAISTAEADGITDFSTPFTAVTNLAGGSDGSIFDANGDLDPTTLNALLIDAYTGNLDDQVIDTEFTYFSLVFDAGYDVTVKDAIKTLTEDVRGDCMGILDMGDNSTAAAALSARQTTYVYNSKYLALYEPYSRIFDNFNKSYIWITPVYHMAKIFAKTDRDYDLWYPPAGLNRGMVDTNELRYELRGGYKDQFILKQINPIMHFTQGFVVWNEATTYQNASILGDIHAMRLVLYITKVLKDALRWFVWEFNDQNTWKTVQNIVSEFLQSLSDALDDYHVEVYASEYDKRVGIMRVDVYITPKRAVKVIKLSLIVS